MTSVEDALQAIRNNIQRLESQKEPLLSAYGKVLSDTVFSPIDMCSFRQSAMDGYALFLDSESSTYEVVGEVAAGSSNNPILEKGQAVRIFTGAMVPDTANCVVQQEIVEKGERNIKVLQDVNVGKNIRPKGEQIEKGTIALNKGDILSPAAIGFLAGLGINEVKVFRKPKITVITTGNELVKPGNEINPGQVYESNSIMLCSALKEYQFDDYNVLSVADNYEATKSEIQLAIEQSDLVILTGGISVGDYDFVGKALDEIGTKTLFYKIKQKPGKPIYVGKWNEKMIAALPGNPAAALTCFYMYVLPALNQMNGKGFKGLEKVMLPIGIDYSKKGARAEFLKAKIEGGGVYPLGKQSSAICLPNG